MAEIVYILCTVTGIFCSVLAWRGYLKTNNRLLFWSSICFFGFALNNAILFIDLVALPDHNLSIWRIVPAFLGVTALIFGLVKEGTRL